ncbi:MAG: hypothetical protein HJJLKODD_00937 [Phycisphaerae bacterium]|nr:hypothetical protein [Phycisphaerae bacterium]
MKSARNGWGWGCCCMVLWMAGCAKPTLMPVAPYAELHQPDGRLECQYDLNNDGRPDYAEVVGNNGRVAMLRYDQDFNGEFDEEVLLEQLDRSQVREFYILLDSIPYNMVAELYAQGRFRFFYPPSRQIAPFPAMTDTSFPEYFGVAHTTLGMESKYYDGQQLSNGTDVYLTRGNARWMELVDYTMNSMRHAYVYLWPQTHFDIELHNMQQGFYHSTQPTFFGYSIATSALGSIHGRNGHQRILVEVDRFCREIMRVTKGRVQITIFSDHGHNLLPSQFVPLYDTLKEMGYRNVDHLEQPNDVIVPRFGPVTAASIYTLQPARVAADVVGIIGVELTAYCEGEQIVICSRNARARLDWLADDERNTTAAHPQNLRFRYTVDSGDPLQLLPIIEQLQAAGKMDAEGFIADADLFAATITHTYPDPCYRLWRAWHGLMQYPAQVLVSLADGYFQGTRFFNFFVSMQSVHGNLNAPGSTGMVITTAGPLPPAMRMHDIPAELAKLGLHPLPDRQLSLQP